MFDPLAKQIPCTHMFLFTLKNVPWKLEQKFDSLKSRRVRWNLTMIKQKCILPRNNGTNSSTTVYCSTFGFRNKNQKGVRKFHLYVFLWLYLLYAWNCQYKFIKRQQKETQKILLFLVDWNVWAQILSSNNLSFYAVWFMPVASEKAEQFVQ